MNVDDYRYGFPLPCKILEPLGYIGRPVVNWMVEILHAETAEHRNSLIRQAQADELYVSPHFDDLWAD